MNALRRWVRFWDAREHGEALALVRICLPLVLLWDLAEVGRYGLVRVLWAPIEEGGLGPASHLAPTIPLYAWLGATTSTTYLLYGITIAAALSLALGLFSRTSALILLLSYAQLEELSPDADRGIDTLLRNVLCILVFSRAGSTLSLSSRWRRGTWVSDELVAAWPRYLIIAQLVVLYFFAGMAKKSANWSFSGGFTALFYVLHQPHHVRFMIPHELLIRAYPLIQFGAAATVFWERGALLLPLLLWLRSTRARETFLHRWVNRLRLLELWVGVGVLFHLNLAVLLALGIFPWGCLALYPALAHPDTVRHWAAQFADAWTRWRARIHSLSRARTALAVARRGRPLPP